MCIRDSTITGPEKVYEIITKILEKEDIIDREKEHVFVIGLDIRNRIKYIELVSLGTLDTCLTHPREIFRYAITKGVAKIITVHNHPSGDPNPSKTDIIISKMLRKAGKILGIELLDDIIIGDNSYFSFSSEDLLWKYLKKES